MPANPTPLQPEELARLGELLSKATPGGWTLTGPYHPDSRLVHPCFYLNSADGLPVAIIHRPNTDAERSEANAELIALLRNAAPSLLTELSALREVAEAAKEFDEHRNAVELTSQGAEDAYARIVIALRRAGIIK